MRLAAGLLCFALIGLAAIGAKAEECFATGHKWEEWNQAPQNLGEVMQLGFTRGFVDTMVLWHRNAGVDPSWITTCIVPKPVSEVRGILDKYVSDHPKNRNMCMADLALAALSEACSGEE